MRRRILLLVLGITALVVLAFAIPLAILTPSVVTNNAQAKALDQARAVGLYLQNGSPTADQISSYLKNLSQTRDRSTAVQLPDGTTIGTLHDLGSQGHRPDYPGASGPGGLPNDHNGNLPTGGGAQPQMVSVPGGKVAELAVGTNSGAYLVQVYVSSGALQSGVGKWWALIAGGSAALLLIGLIGGELLTRRIVRPLLDTAQTAHRISAGDVTARAPTNGPREIAEVGSALNLLADRIDELIAEERETVADLSHRLRTPLTALRLDAEALRDPVEAERVGNHVSVLERMLTAVIRAARRPQREGRLPSCDATEVVRDRVEFWSALADDQRRATRTRLPAEPLLVRASAEDLAAALDALLENVVAHTPEGTPYAVELRVDEPGAVLAVADEGPGISPDAVSRGRSDRGSSGLGLDIARRCAEASGGSMTIAANPSGGAHVELRLGSP
ncbi:MAG: HAMP domain-containing histidine kinase [Actinobacteria bacterium]|nr:HAMP domain-containing histidine kinase [Actinomycetota bacterium]